jgi:multicomponent Na+:H+ antiporter subunit E
MIKRFSVAMLTSYVCWLLFSFTFDKPHLLAGIPVSLIVAALAAGVPLTTGARPQRLADGARCAALFAGQIVADMLQGTFDIVLRLLRPAVPEHAALLHITTSLKSDSGRSFLAIAVSLIPGLMTIDFDGETGTLYVYSLDTRDMNAEQMYLRVRKYEALLSKICG